MSNTFVVGMNPIRNNDAAVEKMLDELVKEVQIKLPENIFVSRFLPLFANTENREDIDLSEWHNISGNGYSEVFVHETGNPDNILYSVPPLLNKETIAISQGINIGELASTATGMNTNFPGSGNNLFSTQIAKHLTGKIDYSIAIKWNAIFKRYGLPEIPLGAVKVTDSSSGNGAVSEQSAVEAVEYYED